MSSATPSEHKMPLPAEPKAGPTPASKFRVMGLVAKAAKRFGANLNPQVNFGSARTSESGSVGSSPRVSATTVQQKHGHASSYLFAPLAAEDKAKE